MYMQQVQDHTYKTYKVKREKEQDASNSMFIIKLSVSTCFGHNYAHHQENKTVSYCMRCSVCVHTAHNAAPQDHSQPQPTHTDRTPHAVRHGLILLMMGIMMPETCRDRKLDNKHCISCIWLVLSLHLMCTMHGYENLKHTKSKSHQNSF